MLTQWNTPYDFDDMFSAMNLLRSTMDRVLDDGWQGSGFVTDRALPVRAGNWPRANLLDAGQSLILTAEIPGMTREDVKLTLNQEVLTIQGERKVQVPEGYSAHRREREAVRFSRSFALPCHVDPERTNAVVKNGVLTVTLQKAPDALPRQITIVAG
ncbi:MAG TPA: Hsp20/alpha crystallin family protein [Polyangiales bacterium]|jgi:HSP20 family protein|nr:Hsp20/alpha crystallin family protein [Polyangiales bacterium]